MLRTEIRLAALACASVLLIGCGTTKARVAKEQLIVSHAVDQAVAGIDFRAMSGETVYLDTQFIKNIKGLGFVNGDYIVSSLRQQMIAADCRLQETREDAKFIVEARVGTLGTDGHEVVYGLPANNALSIAASLVPNSPGIPTVPEVSFARKDAHLGAAKIAVFAYERETKRPVWQSGTSQARSKSQDVWVFGAGPFQRGSIYDGTEFAGSEIRLPNLAEEDEGEYQPRVVYDEQFHFPRAIIPRRDRELEMIDFEEQLPPVVTAPAELQFEEP